MRLALGDGAAAVAGIHACQPRAIWSAVTMGEMELALIKRVLGALEAAGVVYKIFGGYRHRSIDDARCLAEMWGQHRFRRFRERARS